MSELEATLQVNKFARRNRHLKTFSATKLFKIQLGGVRKHNYFARVQGFANNIFDLSREILPIAPGKRLYFQATVMAVSAVLITSLTAGATSNSAAMDYSTDYIEAYSVPGDILVADEDGYLLKVNPQTDESNRIGLTDYAVHSVESGENLSIIADRYGVKIETIMWENSISNANTLRIGQTLLVPPVDGISYKVASGDTLDKIAKKYTINADSIIAQNGIENNIISKGETLFLPGAKPLTPTPIIVNNAGRNAAVSRGSGRSAASASSSSATPSVGKIFIFPTTGKITQGYRGGHYAYDIADRSMPAIWAGAAGTVVKASSGTWGGGYGNHIIIDHGDGVQTLYAHMDSLNVVEGQYVNQGDVVGIMGNTGRVYGATGIHLHWEVMINGVKVNPGGYY